MPRTFLLLVFAFALYIAPLQAAEPKAAVVEVILPANAKLYVGDDLIRSEAGTYRLETPSLEKGKTYGYELRVESERDGKTVTVTRKITVRAGETTKVDFSDAVKTAKNPPKPDLPRPEEVKADKEEFKLSDLEKDILDRTNAERKKKDLPELKPNPKLFAAARMHSEHMARVDKLAHELEGSKLPDRIKEVGYPGSYVGENVAYGPRDGEEVLKGWMNSDGHRKNILEPNYTEIGIGVAKGSDGRLYFTQVFGKPSR